MSTTTPTPPSPEAGAEKDLNARIDRIPSYTSRMRWLIILLALMFGFDLVDIQTFGLVAPALQREWGISSDQVGLLQSMVFVGGLIGALIAGPLADRIGRRPVAIGAVLLFSLGSLASAFAPSPEILGALRVVTGIGVTAGTTAILVAASEFFPKALRGRGIAIITLVSVLIIPLVVIVANATVPTGQWHVVFLFGALGLFVAVPAFWLLPESPRWQASRGQLDRAERTVRLFEDQYTKGGRRTLPAPVVLDEVAPVEERSVWSIFKPLFLRRTIVATLIFVGLAVLNTGVNSWLPVILNQRGHPLDQVYSWIVVLSFGGLAGTFLATFVIELFERKWLVFTVAAVTGVGYLFLGFVDTVPVILGAGLTAVIASSILSTAVFTYTPEIFQTEVRGVGTGFAQAASRIMTIANAVIIGVILVTSTEAVFVYLAAVTVLICVMAVLGPKVGVREARAARRAGQAEQKRFNADAAK
ncbi:MFS transporter [Nonomuraea mesophila]|uniref:MFS transporter n=1 Tax=Nonomuraea mesophila TaxID=2530382 RepID=A0A4R5F980_9ACTN|nr:MFS transporter [Nonomuraea mesophila]TDE45164.1 MFS transporter [Nonomuraea mesophila]